MPKTTALLAALCLASGSLAAQATPAASANDTRIEVRFPNAVHHEAEVSISYRDVPSGPLELRMARSSPGRYAAHDFSKNVYAFRATDGAGRALEVQRVRPNVWEVRGHRGRVDVAYTLFADRADGTYAGVDESRAHLNIPATLAYAPALANRGIIVTFVPPDSSWRVATQLAPTTDRYTFRAPHLQYLMDSPTHLGRLDIREWQVGSGQRQQTIRLALNHLGTADEAANFADLTKRVVDEMTAVFGELPRFDYGTYTFIACYRPNCSGDGMEHRNSTSLTSGNSLARSAAGLLGTVSHEFFHAWNVERIRPAALEPFDFSDANMSGELWFAEGFTNYYGPLVIRRAGIMDTPQYAQRISGAINTVSQHPGRRFFGPVGMSQQAPFVDAATSIDPNNRANMFISYYTYGEAIGLALDLTLRARTPARTLDDVMRTMWRRFGPQTSSLAPVRGYTVADVEAALAEVSGDAAFAKDFFDRYVRGSELPDYPRLLAAAGFVLRPAQAQQAWMGDTRLSGFEGEVVVAGPTTFGTPMYALGLDAGDRLLSMDGRGIGSTADVNAVLASHRPGDVIVVSWRSRGGDRSGQLTLQSNPRLEVLPIEETGTAPSAAQRAFREAWLSSKQR
ncbi:MAG: M61 family metallopeptidase [Gemmatimonadaceae bacterium]|nr:M61 family metallopeptidase [Gemmatimonadaceae bacterium]